MKAIAVDTGGTFTDMVVLDQDTGILSVLKLPSTPDEPGRAIIDGLREIFAGGVAPADMLSLSHGTTVGTNALLTGSGAHVGLFVTEGFGAINDVWHLAPSEDSSRATSVYVEKKPPVLPRFRREAKGTRNVQGRGRHPARRGRRRGGSPLARTPGHRVDRGRAAVLVPQPRARRAHRRDHRARDARNRRIAIVASASADARVPAPEHDRGECLHRAGDGHLPRHARSAASATSK